MPRLIISTDGLAKARYGDLSTAPDIAVPTAQEISYGYTVSDSPRHKRTYVYLELTDEQTLELIEYLREQVTEPGRSIIARLEARARRERIGG